MLVKARGEIEAWPRESTTARVERADIATRQYMQMKRNIYDIAQVFGVREQLLCVYIYYIYICEDAFKR